MLCHAYVILAALERLPVHVQSHMFFTDTKTDIMMKAMQQYNTKQYKNI